MQKIPTVFVRDWENNPKYVTSEPHPDCAWVLDGEGVATRKYDGTCVMYDGERWWARREVKEGKQFPPGFMALAADADTGKTVGWEPVEQSGFAKFHAEAVAVAGEWVQGTYELCGPKINKNPERQEAHVLIEHESAERIPGFPLTFAGIRDAVLRLAKDDGVEGIVWHHPDGRMAKIKARDFDGS
ncbi:hypothetical protein [Spirillospora sp. NPDC048819]|uniref:hypothetical protein n=1 Tax=Spirillospora sp. NPDC048819 TaxID=3155268 RepID=UPI0033C24AD7